MQYFCEKEKRLNISLLEINDEFRTQKIFPLLCFSRKIFQCMLARLQTFYCELVEIYSLENAANCLSFFQSALWKFNFLTSYYDVKRYVYAMWQRAKVLRFIVLTLFQRWNLWFIWNVFLREIKFRKLKWNHF